MKESKLVGRMVVITCHNSWAFGEWGVIKFFDGDDYHIAVANSPSTCLTFARNEFKVKRLHHDRNLQY